MKKESIIIYKKLKNKWGISIEGQTLKPENAQGIIKENLFYPCHWMVDLKNGYKRLTYEEFIQLYGF